MKEFLEKLIQMIREFLEKKEDDRETPLPDFEGSATLGIIVGHTRKARGAVFNNASFKNEYDYNSKVAEIAEKYANLNFKNVLKTHVIFRDSIGITGAYNKAKEFDCDMVIELHFNAFNSKVSGTETLCTPDVGDKAFAKEMQDMQCNVFKRNGNSRGVKVLSLGARGAKNIYSYPAGYNCLVEPFFGDNPNEARLAYDVQDEYAEQIIESAVKFAKNYLCILK